MITVSTKTLSLKTGKSKVRRFALLLVLGLLVAAVVRNPDGAAATVSQVATAVGLFLHAASGGAL